MGEKIPHSAIQDMLSDLYERLFGFGGFREGTQENSVANLIVCLRQSVTI